MKYFNPLSFLARLPKKLTGLILQRRISRTLLESGLFDPEYYTNHYPDLQAAGVDPLTHYLDFGAYEGRNPSPKFDTKYYFASNPDVSGSGMNPLLHYVLFGKKEGRSPLPLPVSAIKPDKGQQEIKETAIQNLHIDYTLKVIFPLSLHSYPFTPPGPLSYLNTWFDEVYLINLKSRSDRLASMFSKLRKLNIQVRVVEAINGYELPHLYEYQQYEKLPPGGSNAPAYEKVSQVKAIVSPGAWGLIKTYRMILHDALTMGYKKILVLEDDAVFIREFNRKFLEFTETLGERNWKILALGVSQHHWQIPENLIYDDTSIRDYSPEQPWYHPVTSKGSFAVGIDSSVFPILIGEMEKMNRPADRVLHSVYETWNPQCYVVQPNLIIADITDSDILTIERQSPSWFYEKQKWNVSHYDFKQDHGDEETSHRMPEDLHASHRFTNLFKILCNENLIPQSWINDCESDFYVFNPAIYRLTDRYAMCYRITNPNDDIRRLATCHLDLDFNPIPGTITALSDIIEQENPDTEHMKYSGWKADARYFLLQGELYISVNNGKTTKPNHQWLIKMDPDGLRPAGKAREIVYLGPRWEIEKNWMFFECDGEVFCSYSVSPHTVFKVSMNNERQVICEDAYKTSWEDDYKKSYGELRCSTPPVLIDGSYISITHSRFYADGGQNSVCGFYEFESQPPFRVLRYSRHPVVFPGFDYQYTMPPLHQGVVRGYYACGLQKEGDDLLLSYGLLNEKAAIAKLNLSKIIAGMVTARPVVNISPATSLTEKPVVAEPLTGAIPFFWWDARQWSMQRGENSKKFSIGNFGDTASPAIVEKLSGLPVKEPKPGEPKLISIGSVIHKASNHDVIWGTGMKGNAMSLPSDVKELTVAAVRGPLTLKFLSEKGINTQKTTHLFDPACLLPLLYKSFIDGIKAETNRSLGPVRIIPHFRDDIIIRNNNPKMFASIISADCSFTTMISKLIGAERVISGSLHGIIFAESLGIPACWIKSPSGEDELKFRDYYYGTERYEVICFDTVEDALRGKPMPLPAFKTEEYMLSFPHQEVRALAKNPANEPDFPFT